MAVIKEADVVAELQRLSAKTEAGFTVDEWSEELGHGVEWVRKMLRRANKQGWLVYGKQTRCSFLDGRTYTTNVYRLVQPPQRHSPSLGLKVPKK